MVYIRLPYSHCLFVNVKNVGYNLRLVILKLYLDWFMIQQKGYYFTSLENDGGLLIYCFIFETFRVH